MPQELAEILDISSAVKTRNKNAKQERQEIVKEGATERKPKYERTEKGYTVYYGKNQKVSATIEEIEKAFKLYCIGGLTLNQTALEVRLTRRNVRLEIRIFNN